MAVSDNSFAGAATFTIMTLSIMTLSIMTLSIMTLSIMDLIVTPSKNGTQHNDPSIMKLCYYTECHYA